MSAVMESSETGLYVASTRSPLLRDHRLRIAVVLAWLLALAPARADARALGLEVVWAGGGADSVTMPDNDVGRRVSDAKLFGVASSATAPAHGAEPAATCGCSACSRRATVAAMRCFAPLADRRSLRRRQEIGAGVRLEAVRPDGVRLSDGGVRRDLALRAPATGARARARPVAQTPSPRDARCRRDSPGRSCA